MNIDRNSWHYRLIKSTKKHWFTEDIYWLEKSTFCQYFRRILKAGIQKAVEIGAILGAILLVGTGLGNLTGWAIASVVAGYFIDITGSTGNTWVDVSSITIGSLIAASLIVGVLLGCFKLISIPLKYFSRSNRYTYTKSYSVDAILSRPEKYNIGLVWLASMKRKVCPTLTFVTGEKNDSN